MISTEKIKYLLPILMILAFIEIIHAQQWLAKFVPTQTVFSQVQDEFEISPNIIRENKVQFKLKEGNLFIGLSLGECINTSWGKWKAEKGKVLDIVFYPKKGRKPSYYKFDNKVMEEGIDSGHKTYISEELGLYYSTQFGKVIRIHYFPSSKYDNLKCNNL